ncbi:MAG: response regulator transcription factor [Elusimicrobia bacterium]|nr:response regulator transcription factor [Elusimicrobiota bacterium]
MKRAKAKGLKVMLCDDEMLFRDILKDRLKSERDITVIGEANSGVEALRLVKELKPDVVLMDISMAGGSGIEATRQITKAVPGTKVLMLSSYTDESHVMEAVQAGAYGYISKKLPTQELVRALRAFAEQGTLLPSPLMQRMVSRLNSVNRVSASSPLGDLTQTQMKVLALLGEGKANKEIAEELGCNVKTIKNHLNVLFQKFDVKNRTEAVVKGIRTGLISGRF